MNAPAITAEQAEAIFAEVGGLLWLAGMDTDDLVAAVLKHVSVPALREAVLRRYVECAIAERVLREQQQ